MPIYEYHCENCGERNEKIQSQPLEQMTCPGCGKKAKRVVSITAPAGGVSDGSCSTPSGSGFG